MDWRRLPTIFQLELGHQGRTVSPLEELRLEPMVFLVLLLIMGPPAFMVIAQLYCCALWMEMELMKCVPAGQHVFLHWTVAPYAIE